jgi:hypothetical protein
MSALMVGYDLNKPGHDYSKVVDYLKSFDNWWHYLDSTWIVVTTKTTSEVRDKLKTLIDANDEVLVINVTGDAWASWLNKDANDWLSKHMSGS